MYLLNAYYFQLQHLSYKMTLVEYIGADNVCDHVNETLRNQDRVKGWLNQGLRMQGW